MKYLRNILILVICLFALFAFLRKEAPHTELIKEIDDEGNIKVCVTRAQIRNEIAPVVIEDFLSRTKIESVDNKLKLVDFGDDSLLSRYGFEKGDIITAINGEAVGSPEEVIKICEAIEKEIFNNRDEKEIDVSVTRDGENINMNFKVPEFVPEKVHYTMQLKKRAER